MDAAVDAAAELVLRGVQAEKRLRGGEASLRFLNRNATGGNATRGARETYTMNGAVLFLHGEDENSLQLKQRFSSFQRIDIEQILIKNKIMPVFPPAEVMKDEVTGENKPMWFNKAPGLQAEENSLGINLAWARILKKAFARMNTKYGVKADKVLVGGFSLGGDMGLQTLRLKPGVGGVWSISGYLPETSGVYAHLDGTPGARRPPVFMAHGTLDDKVPLAWAESTSTLLTARGATVEFTKRKDVGHWLEEVEAMKLMDWIAKTFQAIYADE